MRFKPYPKYKASGVEWFGEVPENWSVKPIKILASINDETLPEATSPDFEIKYVDIGSVSLETGIDKAEKFAFKDAPSRARRIVRDGDVIVSTVRTYLKAIAPISSPSENLIVSTGFAVVRPRKNLFPKFAKYGLQSTGFLDEVIARSTGVSYPAINASDLARIFLHTPTMGEQYAIASFLDRETAKIDNLITKQKKLIELLKEKRQAVISHAVTKGLDPNVPMKPSGVEWLGDVPEHWTIPSLRTIAQIVRGASPRPAGAPQFFNGEHTPWVTVGEITKDELMYLTETSSYLTEAGAARSRLFRAGTLLLSNSGATLGVPKILSIDGCANDGVVGFECLNRSADIQFVYYYLDSLTQNLRERIKQGAGQPNLNTDLVKEIRIGLPPLQEQKEIVIQLRSAIRKSDTLIAKAQQAIALQKEHRTALISAAVTGKIDVRNEVEERKVA